MNPDHRSPSPVPAPDPVTPPLPPGVAVAVPADPHPTPASSRRRRAAPRSRGRIGSGCTCMRGPRRVGAGGRRRPPGRGVPGAAGAGQPPHPGRRAAHHRPARLPEDGLDAWTLPWAQLRYAHTHAIRATLAEKYAPATANRYLAALRGVLREAWRLGQMTGEDLARAVDLPPVRGTRLPAGRAVTAGELAALFASCEPTPGGVRDAALLAVLYGSGMRRAEVAALRLDDFDAEQASLRVLRGKGAKIEADLPARWRGAGGQGVAAGPRQPRRAVVPSGQPRRPHPHRPRADRPGHPRHFGPPRRQGQRHPSEPARPAPNLRRRRPGPRRGPGRDRPSSRATPAPKPPPPTTAVPRPPSARPRTCCTSPTSPPQPHRPSSRREPGHRGGGMAAEEVAAGRWLLPP